MAKKRQPMNIVPLYHVPLHDPMIRLPNGSYFWPQRMQNRVNTPAVDIVQNDTDVTVRMAIPGANADNVRVSATQNAVTVSGEVKREKSSAKEQSHVEEIEYGHFHRSFTLPAEVDPDTSHATYQNGILTLTLPKSHATRARAIQIETSRQQTDTSKPKTATI